MGANRSVSSGTEFLILLDAEATLSATKTVSPEGFFLILKI